MIGITRGQSLQINPVAIPPDPCFAQLGFQNSNGTPVGTTTADSLAECGGLSSRSLHWADQFS
jgi:hypothetical protein